MAYVEESRSLAILAEMALDELAVVAPSYKKRKQEFSSIDDRYTPARNTDRIYKSYKREIHHEEKV
jgi:hypothetical protein